MLHCDTQPAAARSHLEVGADAQRGHHIGGQRGERHQGEEQGNNGRCAPLRLAVLVHDFGLGAEGGVQGAAEGRKSWRTDALTACIQLWHPVASCNCGVCSAHGAQQAGAKQLGPATAQRVQTPPDSGVFPAAAGCCSQAQPATTCAHSLPLTHR